MNYTIYLHQLRENPALARYVGFTSQDPEDRWQKGEGYRGQNFYDAIQKYGWDSFDHNILEVGEGTPSYIASREEYWCNYYKAYSSYTGGFTEITGNFSGKNIFVCPGLDNTSIQASTAEVIQAMNALSPSAFKIWLLYFMNTAEIGKTWCPSVLQRILGIAKKTPTNAARELRESGYLIGDYLYATPQSMRIPVPATPYDDNDDDVDSIHIQELWNMVVAD